MLVIMCSSRTGRCYRYKESLCISGIKRKEARGEAKDGTKKGNSNFSDIYQTSRERNEAAISTLQGGNSSGDKK